MGDKKYDEVLNKLEKIPSNSWRYNYRYDYSQEMPVESYYTNVGQNLLVTLFFSGGSYIEDTRTGKVVLKFEEDHDNDDSRLSSLFKRTS